MSSGREGRHETKKPIFGDFCTAYPSPECAGYPGEGIPNTPQKLLGRTLRRNAMSQKDEKVEGSVALVQKIGIWIWWLARRIVLGGRRVGDRPSFNYSQNQLPWPLTFPWVQPSRAAIPSHDSIRRITISQCSSAHLPICAPERKVFRNTAQGVLKRGFGQAGLLSGADITATPSLWRFWRSFLPNDAGQVSLPI